MLPHKSLNYSENWLEKQKAVENGYQEVLFLNEDGFVTECSASNVFFVKDGVWYTPQLSVGLLNGIMRQRLICAIKQEKWIVKEGNYTLEELFLADQVYLTNSLMGIMPVKRLEHVAFLKLDSRQEQFINNVDKNRQLFR
jgi:branched-subunit amino acid aminotransferase/4-amino-4-deoxychorismate lyase